MPSRKRRSEGIFSWSFVHGEDQLLFLAFSLVSLPVVAGAVEQYHLRGAPPPPATQFSVSGPASSGAGLVFTLTVTALDAANNLAASYSGTVHFTSSDPAPVLPPNSKLVNGTGTFSATLTTAGFQTIASRVAGINI